MSPSAIPLRPGLQADLFSTGGDLRQHALDALRARLTRFASGLSRTPDFRATARARHPIGVEIGELSDVAMIRLAEVVVDCRVPIFVDSGAFGVFMRGLRCSPLSAPAPLNFDAVLSRYDQLLELIATLNDFTLRSAFDADDEDTEDAHAAYARYEDDRMGRGAQEALPPALLVMPDLVGDQLGSIALIARHSAYVRSIIAAPRTARAIIPIQRGPLAMAEAYRRIVVLLGSNDFVVGIPSNAASVTPAEFTAFLREARPRAVHILGAIADSRLTPRLNSILDAGLGETLEVSADANPLRSIIIERGQGPRERSATIVRKLGTRDRLSELDAWIASHGGREGVRASFAAGSADHRERLLGLLTDLTGWTEAEAVAAFALAPAHASALAA